MHRSTPLSIICVLTQRIILDVYDQIQAECQVELQLIRAYLLTKEIVALTVLPIEVVEIALRYPAMEKVCGFLGRAMIRLLPARSGLVMEVFLGVAGFYGGEITPYGQLMMKNARL